MSGMKRVTIYFLAFLTFWLSTWMVTDIHDWTKNNTDQGHPVFSLESHPSIDDTALTDTPDTHNHCTGVCSYDHGGHTGHSFPPLTVSTFTASVVRGIQATESYSYYYHHDGPFLRPPIV